MPHKWITINFILRIQLEDFPGGTVVKNLPANAGARVQALVQEDPTCRGATKPMCYNYWVCALEPVSHNYWAQAPQLLKPMCLEPLLCNKRSHHHEKSAMKSSPHAQQLEKARTHQRRPNTAKKNTNKHKEYNVTHGNNSLEKLLKLHL